MINTLHTTSIVDDPAYRVATHNETLAAQQEPCHASFGCTKCGHGHWLAKTIAVSDNGHYTGARRLFSVGKSELGECQCHSKYLRHIVPAK